MGVRWARRSRRAVDGSIGQRLDGVPGWYRTPVGAEFAYYIGALLRFVVRYLDASIWTPEGSLVSSTMFSATDDRSPATADYVYARWGALNEAQIKVVRTFLEHVAARSEQYRTDANRALGRYWSTARPKEPDYCPVCAYAFLSHDWRPRVGPDEICPCCGIRSGIDDAAGGYLVRGTIYRQWRVQWFEAGMPWRSREVPRPAGWTPAAQLERLRRKG
jgi:hypothetical protein